MGELSAVDNDLDRIWIDPHSDAMCPFVPENPSVNPISQALEKAEMPNWVRSDSRFWIERGGRAALYAVSETCSYGWSAGPRWRDGPRKARATRARLRASAWSWIAPSASSMWSRYRTPTTGSS